MANRAVYHVVPVDDLWVVKLAGDSLSETADDKEQAVARAKELAQRAPLGQVVVHAADGHVERELYYGSEPQ